MVRYLVVLGMCLVVCACASQSARPAIDSGQSAELDNPCRVGTGSGGSLMIDAPVVCVDDTGAALRVTPDPIVLRDLDSVGGRPVAIHWHTVSGANDLRVEIEPGCLTQLACDRPGHCSAKAVQRPDKTWKRCKYDVWTDKHPRLDPDVIITPCC